MKKLIKTLYLSITLFILVGMLAGCVNNTNGEFPTSSPEKSPILELTEEDTTETYKSTSSENSDSNVDDKKDKRTLSQYSSEQIEYARVWLQLGANQDIDGLYVQHIPAGTPLNPDDDIDVTYPEDVIQLTGGRLVDGIVTYSGNGDGTINVYNIPMRWYGGFPPPEDIDKDDIRKEMEDIIKNTELVYVDPGDDEKIIELIELLNVQ
jgi:hypothetical protein